MSSPVGLQQRIPLNNQIGLIGLLLCAFSSPLIMPLNIIAISEKFIEATNGQVGLIATFETLFISISSIILSRFVNKINRNIDFPLNLDISPYKFGRDKSGCDYKLFAVGNHVGQMTFGHCFAFCRNLEKNPDVWFCYNDTNVSKLTNSDPVFSNRAYLLMYQKV